MAEVKKKKMKTKDNTTLRHLYLNVTLIFLKSLQVPSTMLI